MRFQVDTGKEEADNYSGINWSAFADSWNADIAACSTKLNEAEGGEGEVDERTKGIAGMAPKFAAIFVQYWKKYKLRANACATLLATQAERAELQQDLRAQQDEVQQPPQQQQQHQAVDMEEGEEDEGEGGVPAGPQPVPFPAPSAPSLLLDNSIVGVMVEPAASVEMRMDLATKEGEQSVVHIKAMEEGCVAQQLGFCVGDAFVSVAGTNVARCGVEEFIDAWVEAEESNSEPFCVVVRRDPVGRRVAAGGSGTAAAAVKHEEKKRRRAGYTSSKQRCRTCGREYEVGEWPQYHVFHRLW